MGIQTQKHMNAIDSCPRKSRNCHLKAPGPTSFFCFHRILGKDRLNGYLIFTVAGRKLSTKPSTAATLASFLLPIFKSKKITPVSKRSKIPSDFLFRFCWFMINITLSLIPDMTFWGAPYKTNGEICWIVWTDIRWSVTVTATATERCSLLGRWLTARKAKQNF